MFSVYHCFVSFDIKFIALLTLVLMSSSIGGHSKDTICDFIIKDGRVRELGLYQFIDKNETISYRLFSRELDGDHQNIEPPMAEEHILKIENGRVTAQPLSIHEPHGLHKFYGGYGTGPERTRNKTHFNCRVERHKHENTVCISEERAILCECCLKANL